MWICQNNSFISAVQHRDNPDQLVIRARRKEHLQTLFPDKDITVGGSTDYNYRVFVTKTELAEKISSSIMNIDYPNFKDSVEDHDLHNLYSDFWSLHRRFQK